TKAAAARSSGENNGMTQTLWAGRSRERAVVAPFRTIPKKERGRLARFVVFIAGGTPALLLAIA
ncbi:MAG: hypothetical protein LBI59_01975, partial [Candidatus Accumulibacter sp.]|nr:hypothetical protein [Accumulibacter sp.]